MSKEQLSAEEIHNLRASGMISEQEYVYKAGDLVVAENPVTGAKRVLGPASDLISESNRRVLKG